MSKAKLIAQQSPDQSDERLIQEIAGGDRAAFATLHRKYHTDVFRFSFRMLRRHDHADEATNDTMLAVWKSAGSFQYRSKVSTWIFGIAYRAALKTARTYKREQTHVDIDTGPELEDEKPTGAESLLTQMDVQHALDCLPLDLRAVVELTYFQGRSYTEISEILACPVGTVKSRMHAARAKMREVLS